MVICCVAYGCKNLQQKGNNIQFHRFPHKRPEILQKWVHAIRRDKWKPSAISRICSAHFKECDYQLCPGGSKKLLRLNAVPSIFNFPPHLLKVVKSRRVLVRHKEQSDGALKRREAETPTSTAECLTSIAEPPISFVDPLLLIADPPTFISEPPISIVDPLILIADPPTSIVESPTFNAEPPTSIAESPTSITEPVVAVAHKAVQTDEISSPTKQELRRKVKTLQQKIQRKNKRIETMKILIKSLQKGKSYAVTEQH